MSTLLDLEPKIGLEAPRFRVSFDSKSRVFPLVADNAFSSYEDLEFLAESLDPNEAQSLKDTNPLYIFAESRRPTVFDETMLKHHMAIHTHSIGYPNKEEVEIRSYIGINREIPFLSDDFSITASTVPARSMQQEHHHQLNPEIIFAVSPTWVTCSNPEANLGESQLLKPGEYMYIGPNTLHTIANPYNESARHLCVKFPTVRLGDRKPGLAEEPKLSYYVGQASDEPVFSFEHQGIRIRLLNSNDPERLGSSIFGYLMYTPQELRLTIDNQMADRGGTFTYIPGAMHDFKVSISGKKQEDLPVYIFESLENN